MSNQKLDYYNFTSNSGNNQAYDIKLYKKVDWIKENLSLVEEHFKKKENISSLDLSKYLVEGIFVVNTPTFHMYNSDLITAARASHSEAETLQSAATVLSEVRGRRGGR